MLYKYNKIGDHENKLAKTLFCNVWHRNNATVSPHRGNLAVAVKKQREVFIADGNLTQLFHQGMTGRDFRAFSE